MKTLCIQCLPPCVSAPHMVYPISYMGPCENCGNEQNTQFYAKHQEPISTGWRYQDGKIVPRNTGRDRQQPDFGIVS